jgi:hypothetical protein
MTTVSLKLVGNTNDILIHINKNTIEIFDIFNYLMEKGLSFDEISKIMFVHKGKNISNDKHAIYSGTEDDPLIIHLFTNIGYIKDEIIKCIYSNKEYLPEDTSEDNDIPDYCPLDHKNKPSKDESTNVDINNDSDDYEEISQENMNKNNLKTVELFLDKDFSYLLKIFLNKPELINKLSSYIINGNISFEIKEINKDDFKYQNEYKYLQELLNKININIDNETDAMSILQHFEGNLNLTLRYIINKFSTED